MPSEQKIKQNLRAVENAIAQQRLEGLEVPPDIIEEMKRAARGEIEIEEAIRHTSASLPMAKYEGQDHYLDPATGVLQNGLGIS